jgi:hypothetical protein
MCIRQTSIDVQLAWKQNNVYLYLFYIDKIEQVVLLNKLNKSHKWIQHNKRIQSRKLHAYVEKIFFWNAK